MLIALLGGAAGLVLAQWSGAAIRGLLLPNGSAFNLAEDWRTIGVAFACAIVCTLLTALGPSLKATRTDLASMLKSGQREGFSDRSRTQAPLLVLQVALSVVLLVGTGLFVQSLDNVRSVPLGYDARPVLEVIADFRGAQLGDAEQRTARRRLLAEARALPGVAYATAVNATCFRTNTADLHCCGSIRCPTRSVQLPDRRAGLLQPSCRRGSSAAGAHRSRSRRTPLFTVVSHEAMGRVLWRGRDPLGECIHVAFGTAAAGAVVHYRRGGSRRIRRSRT